MQIITKYLFVLLVCIVQALFVCALPIQAEEEPTHTETEGVVADVYDSYTYIKKQAIIAVLKERNSPLVTDGDTFVRMCVQYNIDCYLLPSIAGIESSYGHAVMPGSYNPFGWGGGKITFSSWTESIETVADGLHLYYISQGLVTPEQIGQKYATSDTWAEHVRQTQTQFEKKERELQLYFSEISVQ